MIRSRWRKSICNSAVSWEAEPVSRITFGHRARGSEAAEGLW
jgi:hypothetical protein